MGISREKAVLLASKKIRERGREEILVLPLNFWRNGLKYFYGRGGSPLFEQNWNRFSPFLGKEEGSLTPIFGGQDIREKRNKMTTTPSYLISATLWENP